MLPSANPSSPGGRGAARGGGGRGGRGRGPQPESVKIKVITKDVQMASVTLTSGVVILEIPHGTTLSSNIRNATYEITDAGGERLFYFITNIVKWVNAHFLNSDDEYITASSAPDVAVKAALAAFQKNTAVRKPIPVVNEKNEPIPLVQAPSPCCPSGLASARSGAVPDLPRLLWHACADPDVDSTRRQTVCDQGTSDRDYAHDRDAHMRS